MPGFFLWHDKEDFSPLGQGQEAQQVVKSVTLKFLDAWEMSIIVQKKKRGEAPRGEKERRRETKERCGSKKHFRKVWESVVIYFFSLSFPIRTPPWGSTRGTAPPCPPRYRSHPSPSLFGGARGTWQKKRQLKLWHNFIVKNRFIYCLDSIPRTYPPLPLNLRHSNCTH